MPRPIVRRLVEEPLLPHLTLDRAALVSPIPQLAQVAIDHARRGNFSQALELAKRALSSHPGDHGLMLFVGMLQTRRMELEQAASTFREALRLKPSDMLTRLELARVLVAVNQLDEAEKLLSSRRLTGLEPKRLSGLIAIRRGQADKAVRQYREIVVEDPRDFESWGNLGVALLASGDAPGAVEALRSSLVLRRNQQRFRDKWAEAHFAAGTGEEGIKLAADFVATHPEDVLARVSIARLHDLLGRPERALETLAEALRVDSRHAPALLALAQLHERQNRIDEFGQAVVQLEALDTPPAELPLLEARLAFRRGDLDVALELAQRVPSALDAGDRAHLIGQICDRMGRPSEAFQAFTAMNSATGVQPEVAAARGEAYRSMIERRSKLATRKWVSSWRKVRPSNAGPDPVFIVGFPRSGTTLLDTLLMGHPRICVTEEKPMLNAVARKVGGYEHLPDLTEKQVADLRKLYLEEAARHVPELEGRILVDKQPFAMVDAPLIYRIFPNAKVLFVQRHPCDCVLSCFITRFDPSAALANFVTLEGTARLYGELRKFYSQCRSIMPMIVHLVRYERLVDDAESEMRALIAFLGLEWTDDVLDNRRIAKDRGFINTPSYAQVIEPLYDRSIGRWERYREQMKPVLPMLAPWAKRMGYEV
jgi:Flp pilus assembly protein TadD